MTIRVAVLGRTHWLLSVAARLREAGMPIVLVASAPAAPEYQATEDDFKRLAEETGAFFADSLDVNNDIFRDLAVRSGAEIAVSINWPTLIRAATCASFPLGILNGHGGDLPRYRGNACSNWAILRGESHVGLCVHAMDPDEVDAGPIFARTRIPLTDRTYISDVYDAFERTLPDLFTLAVTRAGDPTFVPEQQSTSGIKPLRCHPRRPSDGRINWSLDAEEIARLVRASSRPFAGAYSFVEGRTRLTIWRASVADIEQDICAVPGQVIGRTSDRHPLVTCGRGVLQIEEGECADGGTPPTSNRIRLFDAGQS